MKVFLDTNVVLDAYYPGREGRDFAHQILAIKRSIDYQICTSYLTVANCAYILRKGVGAQNVKYCIRSLFSQFKVLPMDETQIHFALNNTSPDFEDALQMACAEQECCDCIVSNNKDHFMVHTTIPVYTPAEFLSHILI